MVSLTRPAPDIFDRITLEKPDTAQLAADIFDRIKFDIFDAIKESKRLKDYVEPARVELSSEIKRLVQKEIAARLVKATPAAPPAPVIEKTVIEKIVKTPEKVIVKEMLDEPRLKALVQERIKKALDDFESSGRGDRFIPAPIYLPNMPGNTGKFLQTDGTKAAWTAVPDPLPAMAGNQNKVLTNNGSAASWLTPPTNGAWPYIIDPANSGPIITNADASGTPGTASQINTGDPNTKGLVIKGNTYTPASKTPDQVAGLFAWYKADALTPQSDNTNLNGWPDSGPNGYTLSIFSQRPKYRTNVINGLPAIQFAGNNDYLVTANLSLNQPITYFAVYDQTTPNVGATHILVDSGYAAALYRAQTTNYITLYGGAYLAEASASPTSFTIVTALFKGANSLIRVNATQVASGNAGALNISNKALRMTWGNPDGLQGRIAEAIVYSGDIGANDRLAIESYLSTKYNIAIAGNVVQASNLQEWQSSAGAVLSGIDATGRLVLPTLAGTPADTPPNGTMVYDTTAHKIWIYDGGWKYAAMT